MTRRLDVMKRRGPAIGLFGGSFNPAHDGHRHVASAGLRELQLDEVWWLVSPQNPLKTTQPNPSLRAQTIADMGLPFSMKISHIETELKTQFTVDLIRELQARRPRDRFVLIIGSDNMAQLPRWKNWREIMERIPVAIIARPGDPMRARLGQVARQMTEYRVAESSAHTLKDRDAPAWAYLTLPYNSLSSTAIRAAEQ